MRYDDVIDAMQQTVKGNAELLARFGGNIRLSGSGPSTIPSLEFGLITDAEDEQWDEVLVQIDIWTERMAEALRAERVLRRLFHHDIATVLGEVGCWTMYDGGDSLTHPDKDNHVGRAVRFRLTVLRERYESLQEP